MSKKNNAPQLRRTMTAGQMEMISLGGAIGVGLFMGSTSTIKWTGPSVLLAYMFVGLILYIVMRALGEMLYINPGTGCGLCNRIRSSLSWIFSRMGQCL